MLEAVATVGLGAFYGAPARVLSPSPAADASLAELGIDGAKVGRWERGVDVERFDPAKADRDAYPGEIKVLYAGRLTAREGGRPAGREPSSAPTRADPRLHLLLAGGGPEEGELRARLGERRHLPRLARRRGARRAPTPAPTSSSSASSTDTYGQVILEAGGQRAAGDRVAEGGPAALVENRHTGLLCRPDADHLAGALLQLASAPQLRRSSAPPAPRGARARSWERSMSQLGRRLPAGARRRRGRAATRQAASSRSA